MQCMGTLVYRVEFFFYFLFFKLHIPTIDRVYLSNIELQCDNFMTLINSIVIRFIRHLPLSWIALCSIFANFDDLAIANIPYTHISNSHSNFLFQFLTFGFVYV